METQFNNLGAPTRENTVVETGNYEQPQGDLERSIAQLWQDVFHLDRIGRNDNFFELGGNSLLGMDLSDLFATRLALEVPVLAIFQHPTIREIAQTIASQ